MIEDMASDLPRPHHEDGQQNHRNTTSADHSKAKRESSDAWHRRRKPLMLNTKPLQQCNSDVSILTDDISIATTTANITKRDKNSKNDRAIKQHCKMPFKTAFEKLRRSVGLAQGSQHSIKTEAESIPNLSTNPSLTLPSVYNHSTLHPTSNPKLLLHGALDVPQQYRLRQKTHPDDTNYLHPEGVKWYGNDPILCSHPSVGPRRRNCPVLSLEKRYFTLDESGQVCQYAMEPEAEGIYQITAESIVLASDAVDGQPCSLHLSHHSIEPADVQELPTTGHNIHERPRKMLNTSTEHMIIWFQDLEVFAVWMLAIQRCVERCKLDRDRTISESLFELPAQLL